MSDLASFLAYLTDTEGATKIQPSCKPITTPLGLMRLQGIT